MRESQLKFHWKCIISPSWPAKTLVHHNREVDQNISHCAYNMRKPNPDIAILDMKTQSKISQISQRCNNNDENYSYITYCRFIFNNVNGEHLCFIKSVLFLFQKMFFLITVDYTELTWGYYKYKWSHADTQL